MMKQIKQLKIMASVLAAVIVIYAAVSVIFAGKNGAAGDAVSETASENKTVAVFDLGDADITELSWDNGEAAVDMAKTGGGWECASYEAMPVDQTAVNDLRDMILSLKGDIVEGASDMDAYGLKTPSVSLGFKTSGGEEANLYIGRQTPAGGSYYCTADNSDASGANIYVISGDITDKLTCAVTDYARKDSMPSVEGPVSMTVTADGDMVTFEMFKADDPAEYTYTDYYSWFAQNGGETVPIDRSMASDLISAVTQADWKSVIGFGISDEELTAYGLKDPAAFRAEASNGTDTAAIVIGNKASDTEYYAAPEGSNNVYTIDEDIYELISGADIESVKADDVCHMQWETVTGMDIAAGGETHVIEIARSEESDDGEKYTYTEDGKELDRDTLSKFKEIIDLMLPAGIPEDAVGNTVMEITFHRNTDKFSELNMSIAEYNDTYTAVSFNGETHLVSAAAAGSLVELYNRLFG